MYRFLAGKGRNMWPGGVPAHCPPLPLSSSPARQLTCSLMPSAGNALIVVYGPAEVKFTLEQLRLQWTNTSMVVFIIVLGLLLAALHWGKGYVARLRADAQAASVRARWRSKAMKEPQYMVFGHAMLFSAYAGLIGASLRTCSLPLFFCSHLLSVVLVGASGDVIMDVELQGAVTLWHAGCLRDMLCCMLCCWCSP